MDNKEFINMDKALTNPIPKEKQRLYFTTGSTLLDLVVGGGERINFGMGYQAGDIVRDWGNSASSKTFKLCETIAANHYKYGDKFKWVYDDVERGNKFDSEKLYGFQIIPENPEEVVRSITVEDLFNNVRKFALSLKPDECGIYGLDSLDALSSQEIEERKNERYNKFLKKEEFGAGTYGMAQARFLSQEFFRGLSVFLADHNVLLYIISQERDNINAGPYASKNRLAGGRAIRFYETVRIYSKIRETIEKKGRAIGNVIEVTAEKVRHPRPFRSCFVPIYFDYGIDNIGGNIDFLYDLRTDNLGKLKKKEILTWDGKEFKRDELIAYIEENKLEDVLEKATIDKWEEIEDAIAIKRTSKYGRI